MKVFGASAVLQNEHTLEIPPQYIFKNRPLFKEEMAIDYALSVSRSALDYAYFTPSDIDLIVSLSISPSHLSDMPNIIGPRLGHPIQRELGASNAVVFDLLASDWSFAIDVAYGFLLGQGLSSALIVRGECSKGVLKSDDELMMPNGGGALLLELNGDWHVAYKDLRGGIKAKISKIAVADISRYQFVKHSFCQDEELKNDIAETALKTIEQLLGSDDFSGKTFIGDDLVFNIEAKMQIEARGGSIKSNPYQAGVFSIPLSIAEMQASSDVEISLLCLGFDPFKLRCACYALEV